MTIDICGLSAKELRSLIAQAEKQQLKVLTRPKATAMRAKINKYVKDHGYTIDELYGTSVIAPSEAARKRANRRPARSTVPKTAPKYRNPAVRGQTWSGRGRQPRWIAELVANGRSLSDLLIK
ncbi:H-NS histone family protein [Stenotrophomonas maltophilia]|uniref:H-NS histone family protein n=1 Tax=Stenotrophomonas TaxID=40323 RepID=UPI0021C960A2|nr:MULTISPECIES: H-NS histone family protein [Stenotrophomonas]MCU0999643.1 H-NS histone family protein [Stenotrophomonas maltophilia]